MKNTIRNNIKLGIFISLGLAVFMAGVYFIGARQQLFSQTFRINGIFNDVAGLQVGCNVRLSGVTVGTIDDISIVSDTLVRVELIIDEDTRKFIKKDAIASIGTDGLMGNKVLIINPGTGSKEEIRDNDRIKTTKPINLDEILISLKTTTTNIAQITNNLAGITNNIQAGNGTIGKLLMDRSMAQNFDSSLTSLKHSSEELEKVIVGAKSGIVQNFDSAMTNLKDGSVDFKLLMQKAKKSWLVWGFK